MLQAIRKYLVRPPPSRGQLHLKGNVSWTIDSATLNRIVEPSCETGDRIMRRLNFMIGLSLAALMATAWAVDLSGFIVKSVQDKVGGYQLLVVPT